MSDMVNEYTCADCNKPERLCRCSDPLGDRPLKHEQPSSKERTYLEWRRRDDAHQDKSWTLVIVTPGSDTEWELLHAPERMEIRGAADEPSARHERRVIGHASGWQEQTDACVCGKKWPCTGAPEPPSVSHTTADVCDRLERLEGDVLRVYAVDISDLTDELIGFYRSGGDAVTKPAVQNTVCGVCNTVHDLPLCPDHRICEHCGQPDGAHVHDCVTQVDV